MTAGLVGSSTPDYTMGYGEEYLRFISYYNAEDSARHLLPRLRAGDRILDLGCGPGFVAVGLAEAVAPGTLYGVDMEPSQVEEACRMATERGSANTVWQVADVMDLPFEDGFFDIVHCNDVLAYIPDTAAVLAEIKRVIRPAGILGCREMIVDSCFLHPELGAMKRGWDVFADLIAADDGHPQMGKDLKSHLVEAGFADISISGSFETYSEPESIEQFYRLVKKWFLSVDVTRGAKMYGAATDSLLETIDEAIEQWRVQAGAVAFIAFGEAVAVRP